MLDPDHQRGLPDGGGEAKISGRRKDCTLLRLHPASLSTDAAEFCPMRAFASPVALFVVDSVGDIRYTLDRPGLVGM